MTISESTNLLTINESARILHVHESTLRHWCTKGLLPAFRIGPRGERRILDTDVLKLLKRIVDNYGRI